MIQTRQSWEVCGECKDGQEAITMHAALKPHIIVLDFNMPTLNGLEAARQILKECPSACILILSISDSPALVEEAKNVGVRGFCSKNTMEYFFEAVETILRGETSFFRPVN
jgi:DNA-binding NarL/FixJ family response regulator